MAGRLYPPILDYSMPAFVLEGTDPIVRIYFALSVYNSWSEVGSVHMTVRYLESNANALGTGYPAKIKVVAPQIDEERVTRQDKYYVELANSDLADGFVVNTTYKIQLRFSKLPLSASGAGPRASWFNENYINFSEWSTVSLIRPIKKPVYSVLGLEEADSGAAVNFASLDSIFTVTYETTEDSEPLKAWRGRLYSAEKRQLLADSGETVYSNYSYLPVDGTNAVAFDIILPYQMTSGVSYVFQLDILTRNGYSTYSDYPFTCFLASGEDFRGTIQARIDEDEAYARVQVKTSDQISNNLIIRRSSSESGFSIWEDISVKTFKNEIVDWVFYDFTIESGIWYRYGVQVRDIHGHRGAMTVYTDDPLMGEFESAFLLDSERRQLKLKYDFNISTANITVSESKTDTIGSKFPFVRRNGDMYYRTFQCTGLITGYMDEEAHIFTDDTELYHGEEARYAEIRDTINLRVNQYDYTYEREFREKVQEFLYNDKVKLFRSLQEGNILVKLMNISLTPKNELGRLLYSFSCQAIEIDEPSLVNLDKYGIQTIGYYSDSINFSEDRIGQLSSYEEDDQRKVWPANTNFVQEISKQYGWMYDASGAFIDRTAINNIIVRDFQLTHFRIEFESDPYLIQRNGSRLTPFTGTQTEGVDLILGWLLQIDNETILIQPPNHIYELKEEGLVINSNSNISCPVATELSIYYLIQLEEELDTSIVPISTTYYELIGQMNRIFKPGKVAEDVISLLSNRYTREEGNSSYTLDAVFSADIDAEPGTIVYARSSAMDTETKFVVNDTGYLLLEPGISGVKIEQLHFEGKQIDIRYLDPLYYWNDQYHYDETEVLTHFNNKHNCGNARPKTARDYDYYTIGSSLYMFYNREWRNCVKVNDFLYEITCPVSAIINYRLQQKKGVYQRS